MLKVISNIGRSHGGSCAELISKLKRIEALVSSDV
jgi:hypothetical protein